MTKLLSWVIIVLLVLFLIHTAHTAELPKEMFMKTDVGEVVLTTEECAFKKMGLQGYEYAAYATEKGHANHEGCWKSDSYEGKHAVFIYFPELNQTAVFDAKLFKPRTSL